MLFPDAKSIYSLMNVTNTRLKVSIRLINPEIFQVESISILICVKNILV